MPRTGNIETPLSRWASGATEAGAHVRMIEKVAHIRNPLTVIAMFAGIAEVSGTLVLPLLDKNTQYIYVWFLMAFPCFLVAAFFGTLLFKHHVLYAPSDFKDEQIFANMFKPGSPRLRAEKFEEEASADVEAEDTETAPGIAPAPPAVGGSPGEKEILPRRPTHLEFARQAYLAEDLVITSLASERQLRFDRNVSPSGMPRVMFDAVAKDGNNQIILEVKYTRAGFVPRHSMERLRQNFESYYESLPEDLRRGTSLIIAIVLDENAEDKASIVEMRWKKLVSEWNIPTNVRIYSMAELQKSFLSKTAG